MTESAIRDIQLTKGGTFTVQFMIRFDKEWSEITRSLRKSGKKLKNIPIVRR